MPEFTGTIAIKNGKHPIKFYLDPDTFVANDVFSDAETTFLLITGPNMVSVVYSCINPMQSMS